MWSTNFITLAVLFIAIIDPSIAQSEGAGAATTAAPTASGAEVAPGAGASAGAGGASRGPEDDLMRTLVTFKLFEPLSFNCTSQTATDAATRYEWYRNGTLFEAGGPKGWPTLDASGAVLSIRRAHEEDWGNYTCRVGRAVAGAWQAEALNLPRVPANTNVVEGQKFSITCKIIGKPHQPVTWWYRPSAEANLTQLSASEGGRVLTRDSPAGVPGGVLEMSDAARADAGEYLCRAGGPAGADVREDISTVRVKDVYAALWPFLGICLEVFVLCAIILVYEKRRTKPELDDSDADTHDQ